MPPGMPAAANPLPAGTGSGAAESADRARVGSSGAARISLTLGCVTTLRRLHSRDRVQCGGAARGDRGGAVRPACLPGCYGRSVRHTGGGGGDSAQLSPFPSEASGDATGVELSWVCYWAPVHIRRGERPHQRMETWRENKLN